MNTKTMHAIYSRISLLAILATIALSLGCSSNTSTNSDDLQVQADMTTTQVSAAMQKGAVPSAGTVTSITISSVKLLVSELKLEAKSDGSDVKVKDGPAILSVDASGAKLVVTSAIPSATYNKASLKIHRLTDDERNAVLANPDYADFITNDRASVVIGGTLMQNGVSYPFTYFGKIDETINLNMEDVSVNTGNQSVIAIQLDPVAAFKDPATKALIDPRDNSIWAKIDDAVKKSLKAIRKS